MALDLNTLRYWQRINTNDNETFIDVLKNVNILPDQWVAYYHWIGADFEFGHLHKGKTFGLHFANPWGVNSSKSIKPLSKQSRFNDGQKFPMAEGKGWEYIAGCNDRANAEMSSSAQSSLAEAAIADVRIAVNVSSSITGLTRHNCFSQA